MIPALTRRGLVQAGAAALGATVAGVAAFAHAGVPDPDAPLFAALARYDDARAAWLTTHAPHDEAMERAFAAYPPRPPALTSTGFDTLAGLKASGREKGPDGRIKGFFVQGDVDRLRDADPVTELAWTSEGERLPPVPYPKGEARRQAIIASHDRWAAECAAVDEAVGLLAAVRTNDAACEVLNDAEDALERLSPCTLPGLVARARWAVETGDAAGSDGPLVTFAREVAALGGSGT